MNRVVPEWEKKIAEKQTVIERVTTQNKEIEARYEETVLKFSENIKEKAEFEVKIGEMEKQIEALKASKLALHRSMKSKDQTTEESYEVREMRRMKKKHEALVNEMKD